MATLTELTFGNRIQPEEVTPQVRAELTSQEWSDEGTWTGIIIVFAVAVALAFSLAYRWHAEARFAELPAVAVVAVLAVAALVVLHVIYMRRRAFVSRAPVTAALVLEAKPSYKYTDDSAAHQKTLKLRYAPGYSSTYEAELAVLAGDGTVTVETELSPHAHAFGEDLQNDGLVTVLYDPQHLHKVRVIEKTVRHTATPAAA